MQIRSVINIIREELKAILDLFFPRHCAICGCALSTQEDALCISCWLGLNRTGFHLAEHSILETFYWGKVPVERAAAMFYYDASSRNIIFHTKYYNNPYVGENIAMRYAKEVMAESDFFDGIDAIIPIPLHSNRKRKRGYNQCEYIAHGISKATGIPVIYDAVTRTVNNESQTKIDAHDRAKNVEDIFLCRNISRLTGKHLLIIDDVITTGNTSLNCAKAIMRAEGAYKESGLNIGGSIRFSFMSLASAMPKTAPMNSESPHHYADEYDYQQ